MSNAEKYTIEEFRAFLTWLDDKYSICLAAFGYYEYYPVIVDEMPIVRRIGTKESPNRVITENASIAEMFEEYLAWKLREAEHAAGRGKEHDAKYGKLGAV